MRRVGSAVVTGPLSLLVQVVELPLTNPELFVRVGIKPPKGVLLYGPPGTGKTLLARALACNLNATFLKVVASAIVDKYIGESSRVIREMFGTWLSCAVLQAPATDSAAATCQGTPRTMRQQLSSWTKSTRLAASVSRRVLLLIAKSSER